MQELSKVLDYYKIPFTSTKEKIICPLHADVNASLLIDIDNNNWYCFGCQMGGDAFKLHKEYQNKLGNNDDFNILVEYNKILKSKKQSRNLIKVKDVVKDKKYYRQKMNEAKDFYYGLKTVDWSKEDNEAVYYMQWRGYTMETLNIVQAKNTYQDAYPIVFPIMDNGRFKGWVSRTFDKEIESKRKYLYNEGFRRRYTIAGDYKNTKVVMLVEGYMDMVKAKQLGIENVGAILGWKITNWQVEKLKDNGAEIIISALDNDKCGCNGLKELRKHFKNVIKFPYPKNIKDMGDMTPDILASVMCKVNDKIKKIIEGD